MTDTTLPSRLISILEESFYIRTTLIRKNGSRRTFETTYYWDGNKTLVLSGYPGKRDWVASISRNPKVIIHTVESDLWYDIPATASVITEISEKLPHIFKFIERWAERPEFPRKKFLTLLAFVKINLKLKLPWWGPFIFAKKIFQSMPCVVIEFDNKVYERKSGGPPRLSEQNESRPF